MTTAPLAAGEKPLPRAFGRYTLFDLIGKGGMAEIFLARASTELGATRLAVVKQVLPSLADNASFAELLITEAKLAARLNHANVVHVTDLGRHGGQLFIAMEYVEGFDLNDLLRRCSRSKTPLPIEFALLIVTEALRGLDYAHRRTDDEGRPIGLVHRDVSPSNVLVSFEGEVKLCDFGIAHANDVSSEGRQGVIQGKAGYMSPEHARGEALDARADVFAVGIILWELLAGRRYYRAAEGESLLALAREAAYTPPPPRDLPHESELHAIVARALQADRDARFPSAQAMLRDLESFIAQAGLFASPLRLGAWLRERFADETLDRRRSRERALRALDLGKPAVITPVAPPVAPVDASVEVPVDVLAEAPAGAPVEVPAAKNPAAVPLASPPETASPGADSPGALATAPGRGGWVVGVVVAMLLAAALIAYRLL